MKTLFCSFCGRKGIKKWQGNRVLSSWEDNGNTYFWVKTKDVKFYLLIFFGRTPDLVPDLIYEWIPSVGFRVEAINNYPPRKINNNPSKVTPDSCWEKCKGLCDRPECHKTATGQGSPSKKSPPKKK